MSLDLAIRRNYSKLQQAALGALRRGLLQAWKDCAPGAPGEPDFVACLSLHTVPDLQTRWEAILRPCGVRLAIAGVFCHQKPIVDLIPSSKRGCELGDILVVHIHHGAGVTTRVALLLQAKISPSLALSLKSSELHQLRLYELWPTFRYRTPSSLRGRQRSILPQCRHLGAQYLLIDGGNPTNPSTGLASGSVAFPLAVSMATNPLIGHASLDEELVKTLLGLSGRPFADRKGTGKLDGWSSMVWDLLELAAAKAAFRRRAIGSKLPRYSGQPLAELDGEGVFSGGRSEFDALTSKFMARDDDGRGPDGGAGVSVIVLETFFSD